MPHYVLLMKLTEKGTAAVGDAAVWMDASTQVWHQSGGKMLAFCATLGEYDFVALGEAPTDERAAAFALALSRQGLVSTTTLRGFTRDDLVQMGELMPELAPPVPSGDRDAIPATPPEDERRPIIRQPDEPPKPPPGNVRQPDDPPAPPRGNVRHPDDPPTPTPPPDDPPR